MDAAAEYELDESDEEKEDDNPQDGEQTRAGGKKSAEALERAERLQANLSKYEGLSDQELERTLPKKVDGGVTSIGAMLHASETCQACSFFHYSMKGCHSGIRCKFCHAEHPKKEKKRNRQRKRPGGVAKEESVPKSARTDHDRSAHGDCAVYDPAFPGVRLDHNGNSRPSWLQDEDVQPSTNYGRPAFTHPGSYGPYGPPPCGAYGAGYGPYGHTAMLPGGHPYGAAPHQQPWGSPWGSPPAR